MKVMLRRLLKEPGFRRWTAGVAIVAALVAIVGARLAADDWPEWRGAGRLGVWHETGLVEKFPAGGPPAVWRTPIHGGYAGPAVAGGRVFITDSRRTKGNQAIERAVALDERTGAVVWTHEWPTDYSGLQLVYAIGPRATPTVDGDRVYVVGAMGNLFALDAETGRVAWQKDYVKDLNASIPSWGIAGAPLVDGNLLICLTGGEPDAKLVAFDKRTGKEVWRALSSDTEPGYNQPVIIEAGGARQLILFHPQGFTSLDPATGRVYWEIEHRVQMGIVVATPIRSGRYLFFTSQYGGARMLQLDEHKPAARLLWSGPGEQDPGMSHDTPDTFNSVISTPVIEGGHVYGLDNDGQLRCLDAATGKEVWKTDALLKERAMYGTAFFVRNGDRFFINNDRGELVIAKLSPKGFEEIDRARLVEPTNPYVRRRQIPKVLWTHAAYANRHVVIRNDHEIARFSLAAGQPSTALRLAERMSPEQFRAAGLSKLTGSELASLERWIESHPPADDAAGRRRLVQNLPDVIESRIAGTFTGWNGDTIFTLMNGQVWQQSSYADQSYYLHGPDVRIYRTPAGYRMRVDGADQTILVQRVK